MIESYHGYVGLSALLINGHGLDVEKLVYYDASSDAPR